MTSNFREKHLLALLEGFSFQNLPLDVFIRNYLKTHKAIGAHDRRYIAESVYTIIRWLAPIDFFCSTEHSWKERLKVFKSIDLESLQNQDLPKHIKVSCPKKLFEIFVGAFGEEKAQELCLTSNTQAPTTVRVNALKIDRQTLFNKWKEIYDVSICEHSPYAIRFNKRENFFGMEDFKNGFFEIQDEGSQLIAFLVKPKPGQQVLDFCSGSGGKTLAFAPFMEGKGQIYLHDIRKHVLIEAKKRLCRAGIQNAQTLQFDDAKKAKLKGKMDWILVDGPCSGTGTLRRNPDMKWRFDTEGLPKLALEQRNIFHEALSFLKPGGKIVFATCSILPQENEDQVKHFLNEYSLTLCEPPLSIFPKIGGMDGFFGAVFEKPKN